MTLKQKMTGCALTALACLFLLTGPASADDRDTGGVPIREVVISMASRMIRMNPRDTEAVQVFRQLILKISEMGPVQAGRRDTTDDRYRDDRYQDDRYRDDRYRDDRYDDRYYDDRYDDRYRDDTRTTTRTDMSIRRMTGADMGPIYTVYTMILEYHKNYGDRETRQVFLDIIKDLTDQLVIEEPDDEPAAMPYF